MPTAQPCATSTTQADQTNQHCSGRVWAAAYVLYDYLISPETIDLKSDHDRKDELPEGKADVPTVNKFENVLELGAGTGWLALQIHNACPAINWCATEAPHFNALERLVKTIADENRSGKRIVSECDCVGSEYCIEPYENVRSKCLRTSDRKVLGTPRCNTTTNSGILRAEPLDWVTVNDSALLHESWDLILGSDLVYSPEGARLLCECLHSFLTTQTGITCLYAHTCGRWNGHGFDEVLYYELQRVGLESVAVGGDTLEGSSERIQHVVVFQIRIQRAQSDRDEASQRNRAASMADAQHVLLRASRLGEEMDKRLEASMTTYDLQEMQALQQMFGEL